VQRAAFGIGDQERRGARARLRAARRRDARQRRATRRPRARSGRAMLANQPPSAAMRRPSMRRDRSPRRLAAASTQPVGAVEALHRVVGEREVARAARERAEVVEAGDERIAAVARQPAVGRLQAEDAAQRRRHADRAVGVGAERERHLAGRDRRGRAARRAAGHAREVVRVARRPVVAVLGREAVGVLVHVERADEHRAGRSQRATSGRRAGGGASRSIFEPASVVSRRRRTGSSPRTARRAAAARAPSSPPRARIERGAPARARSRVTSVKALTAGRWPRSAPGWLRPARRADRRARTARRCRRAASSCQPQRAKRRLRRARGAIGMKPRPARRERERLRLHQLGQLAASAK
jgi:hypothetical protein